MRPATLLPWLLGAAVGAAGLLQGLHWRSSAPASTDDERDGQIIALEQEVALLKRENASLRSLAQGGGEVHVDPALIDFVGQSLGLDFKSNPQVHRIATEELRDRIVATIEARYGPHGLDSRQRAWSLIGLLNSDDRFAHQLAATKAIGARSWFDDLSGEAWVTDRFDSRSVPDQAALVRALVRILIHQHYPPPPGWPGDEAAIAREALHHGAALTIENRYLARQALATGFTGVAENPEARELLESLPPFVRGLATFPASLGQPRAERLMDQEEILSALHHPPALSADFFPDHEGLATAPLTLPETDGNVLLEESAGMLGLKLWLTPLGEEATRLADRWRGDRYRLHATSDLDVHLVWDIRFDTPDSADAFTTAAGDLLASLADTEAPPSPDETLSTPEGRLLTMSRPAPGIVRFTNRAPSATAK